MAQSTPHPRIGIVGAFDADDFDAALTLRVVRRELRDRLADAEVRVFAPFGWERPSHLDAGEPAEPLGPFSEARSAELAEQLDLMVVVPTDLDAAELARRYGADPADVGPRSSWLTLETLDGAAFEAVRDEPHVGHLVDRLLLTGVLEKRLRYLRLMGWYPDQGPVSVEERDGTLTATGGNATVEVPSQVAFEDLVAVLATADAADLTSRGHAAVRRAYTDAGVDERRTLDAWFDAVAERAVEAATGGPEGARRRADEQLRGVQDRLRSLETAHEARGHRLVDERLVFADHVDALQREFGVTRQEVVEAREAAERSAEEARRAQAEADEAVAQRDEADALRREADRLREEADRLRAEADAELAAMTESWSWRLTRPLRAFQALLRRRR